MDADHPAADLDYPAEIGRADAGAFDASVNAGLRELHSAVGLPECDAAVDASCRLLDIDPTGPEAATIKNWRP